jgi:hypothetical protein
VFDENLDEIFIKDLCIGFLIMTKDGPEEVTFIETLDVSVSMFDITVEDENHRFYSNDILSHNTISSSIFIAWYLLFNFDKNALILSNKGDTTREIVDKAKVILESLPLSCNSNKEIRNRIHIQYRSELIHLFR